MQVKKKVVSSKLYQCHVTCVTGDMTTPIYVLPAPLEGDACLKLVQEKVSKIPQLRDINEIFCTYVF